VNFWGVSVPCPPTIDGPLGEIVREKCIEERKDQRGCAACRNQLAIAGAFAAAFCRSVLMVQSFSFAGPAVPNLFFRGIGEMPCRLAHQTQVFAWSRNNMTEGIRRERFENERIEQ